MTLEEIKGLLNTEPYQFLWTNPHLQSKILFLTLGGSYAYGTNNENSDVDIRGCAANSRTDILGLTTFEQAVDKATDTTIYGFNKFIRLLISCNPNAIEMLGCKPEHYLLVSETGRRIIENRRLFVTQQCLNSYRGYATQQLRRLENAIARDSLPQARKEQHILAAMERATKTFKDRYETLPEGGLHLKIGEPKTEGMDKEILVDMALSDYPARNLSGILNDLLNVVNSYDSITRRTHQKDDNHLNKHAMHLIKLYLICIDMLEKGDIITYRGDDIPMLMHIRNGEFMNPDRTYKPEFFEIVREYEERLDYAAENTFIPEKPDMAAIQELVMSVNRDSIK